MTQPLRPAHELADIVSIYADQFITRHAPRAQHLRVLNAIRKCRTAALGGHLDKCDACGHQRISYNSCRNRHCPKCQGTNRERWILDRHKDLLPVTYFHLVFTIPSQLNDWCLQCPKAIYDILFQASRQTIEQLGNDPQLLGAQMGMISVLHTWGQQLWLHPHVHCIVPGGGITADGHWKSAKSNGKYLFPVTVISKLFRGKFLHLLRNFARRNDIELDNQWVTQLYKTNWVVYAKEVFAGPSQVIEYLGRYSHRVAISNHRLLDINDGKVTFTYKDYNSDGKKRVMTLEAVEFLRRFCLHILPPGFVKIRHSGFLASRLRPKLRMQQMMLGVSITPKQKLNWKLVAIISMNFDPDLCPHCKKGKMVIHKVLLPEGRSPPVPLPAHG